MCDYFQTPHQPEKVQFLHYLVSSMRESHNQLQTQLRDVRTDYERIMMEARRKEEARRIAQGLPTQDLSYPRPNGIPGAGSTYRPPPLGTGTPGRTYPGPNTSNGTTTPRSNASSPIVVNVPV